MRIRNFTKWGKVCNVADRSAMKGGRSATLQIFRGDLPGGRSAIQHRHVNFFYNTIQPKTK